MDKLSLVNPFGAPVYYQQTLSSTMDVSRELARAGEGHGTVITADFQEAGRGSRGRPWQADRGRNLVFTILLRYPGFSAIPRGITLRTGLALSLAIEDFAPALAGSVWVKWPNDVMIASPRTAASRSGISGRGVPGQMEDDPREPAAKKTAGILAEGDGKTVFIGIGVNLAQTEFSGEYRSKATSIALALADRNADRHSRPGGEDFFAVRFRLLEGILSRLFEEFSPPEDSPEAKSWRKRLEERLYMRGRAVRFFPHSGPAGAAPYGLGGPSGGGAGEAVEGRLAGIGPKGELLILPEGAPEPLAFVSGELAVYRDASQGY
ncbi:MAG: biotin--[acetyl-CoA-carboxylase] ligase family protein [Treponema sp.]|jgi:BirA family biotin operon repressor/biotin-[acetyl-CoA-carboxylase] ligase|nr:biotin--[acetyl-CoA-carboxylase] ligase family protein [Treponema sp.]